MPSRAWFVVLSLLALASAAAHAQEARRGIPRALREALVGCWELPDGEVHVVERRGESGLSHRWFVTGGHGARRMRDTMYYRPRLDAVQGGCGATTQHGQLCLFRSDASGVRATRVARRSGSSIELSMRRCTAVVERSVVRPREPEVRAIPSDAPIASLLSARRRAIDAGRTPTGEEAGWVRYGDELAIRYEAGLAMRVRVRVPAGASSCDDVVRAAGFSPPPGTAPLRRRDGCEWPGTSERHRLAPRVGARLEGGVLEIWRR